MGKIKIGYQGIEGSNAEKAARHFQAIIPSVNNSELIPSHDSKQSKQVVHGLLSGELSYGVLAVSNSIGGIVPETNDALSQISYKIISDHEMQINHCLCAAEPIPLSSIKQITSHQQALIQCSDFIKRELPNALVEEAVDTALAAKELSEGNLPIDCAVICPKEAAEKYNLDILRTKIANTEKNTTRFILISNPELEKKSSAVFLLNYHNSKYILQIIIAAACISSILINKFLSMDIYQSSSVAGGVAAAIIAFLKSDYFQNYVAFKNIGGHWKYYISQFDEKLNLQNASSSVLRIVEISFSKVSGQLIIKGWLECSPKAPIFYSLQTYFSDFKNEKGIVIYEYTTSEDSPDNLAFQGFTFLEYFLQNTLHKINRLTGRYIGKASVSTNIKPDTGRIEYTRITKEEFNQLKYNIK
jgi:prephenate dehydratase